MVAQTLALYYRCKHQKQKRFKLSDTPNNKTGKRATTMTNESEDEAHLLLERAEGREEPLMRLVLLFFEVLELKDGRTDGRTDRYQRRTRLSSERATD